MSEKDKNVDSEVADGKTDRRDLLQIFKKGAEFTEELLQENERLRFRLAELETTTRTDGKDNALVKQLLDKVQRLEEERQELVQRFAQVEAANKNFQHRYSEIEIENNNLMNIYVASYQLHSTLDFSEVLRTIREIIVNLVGAESFVIGLTSEDGGPLHILIAEGNLDRSMLSRLSPLEGRIGEVVSTGDAFFSEEIDSTELKLNEPLTCVPLKIKSQVIGVILVYRFLQQKNELMAVDHELFTLLAGHAATAIFSSKLYTDSKRKLKTIQGFIELMTSDETTG